MGIASDYCAAVHAEQTAYAAWPPNNRVKLGDYGELDGKRFVRLGNVADSPLSLGVDVRPEPEPGSRYRVEFATDTANVRKFGANATIGNGIVSVNPGLQVEFTSQFGLYMSLSGVQVRKIENLAEVALAVCAAARRRDDDPRKWHDRRYVLVTEVYEATNAVALLSSRRGSRVVLEATARVPSVDLANLELSFEVRDDTTSTQQFFPDDARRPLKLAPFFALAYVDRGFLGAGSGELKPRSIAVASNVEREGEGAAVLLSLGSPSRENWLVEKE